MSFGAPLCEPEHGFGEVFAGEDDLERVGVGGAFGCFEFELPRARALGGGDVSDHGEESACGLGVSAVGGVSLPVPLEGITIPCRSARAPPPGSTATSTTQGPSSPSSPGIRPSSSLIFNRRLNSRGGLESHLRLASNPFVHCPPLHAQPIRNGLRDQ